MEPVNNRIFCPDCGRQKMLFETEVKAQAFMRFNNNEIDTVNGYAPTRSYFCIVCGGWHLTSKMGIEYMMSSKTKNVLQKYEDFKRLKEQRRTQKLLHEKEREEILEKLLQSAENNIQTIEYSTDNISKYGVLFEETAVLLEKIKNINAHFKGSSKRKREIEIKLNFLGEKFRNSL